jgi:hypothetical protein
MRAFNFTIIASGLDPHTDDFADRFFEAGCGDATISFQKGVLILEFTREAKNVTQAIFSAIRDVQKAGATVINIEPDHLVSLSDIANRAEISRAAASHYAKGLRGKAFPLPVARITTDSPLWDWFSVSRWLRKRSYVSHYAVIEAKVIRETNLAIRGENTQHAVFAKKLAELKQETA